MTTQEIESILNKLPYDVIVFDGDSFPSDIQESYGEPYVRYAKKSIDKDGFRFSEGWVSTDYDYEQCTNFKILFTTYNNLITNGKKLRLLNAIKGFK